MPLNPLGPQAFPPGSVGAGAIHWIAPTGAKRPKGDDSNRPGLFTILVKPLAYRDNLAPDFRILFDEAGNAFAPVENGGVIPPS